ncbi:Gfo/Idh/MocA family protein [Cognatishimia maritima]|uniref:Predicted dehydrogenase n=1 Tax=Cognatishimia maritima TaxID=870908 RepID=A0A1M5QWS8_9RHOB|nr:Gfo/Idh/MocA family oxidoreductase [Cognatishimia maritima]SHH18013.1 Predicted dehydrogenase [Cognatishimia maritima]
MKPLKFAAIGLDHRHIYGMTKGMIDAGAELSAFWTEGTPGPLAGFLKRFPDAKRVPDLAQILEDQSISLVLIAAPPAERAVLSIQAMLHGKDVMMDKPGCLTPEELEQIEHCIHSTGRIWSVNFSERFEVPAITLVDKLLAEGRIGDVVHTLSVGPHRLNAHMRPDWFWDPKDYGGILGDIGTHQIDQFLHFTKATDATVTRATVGNFNTPQHPRFQDFGEMNLSSATAQGYVRLDWYTPDAAPNWGDGRLTILGTEGYIEIRKYMDIAGRPGTDHVFLVNGSECTYLDGSDAGTPYFVRLRNDIENRTESACPQDHTLRVMRLALEAQNQAIRLGNLANEPT